MANGQLAPPTTPAGPARIEEMADRRLLERFVRRRDEAAFAALVRRHGPMVLGVCRRILRNHQDAEDAFQATFLVLVRKAGAIGRPELLANWLYGVAFRTAQQARAKAARRGHHEREAASMSAAESEPEPGEGRELREVIDQALFEVPEKYRAPLVLCYLEGKTNEEAAHILGWPTGSMSARLARGRELLRERLATSEDESDDERRRGVPLLAGFGPTLLAGYFAPAALPAALADTTVRAALGLLGAQAVPSGLVSPAVGELMKNTLATLPASRRWLWRGLLALLALFLLGAAAYAIEGGWPLGGYSAPASGGTHGSSCHPAD